MTAQVKFGLLGPVRAWQGDSEVDLGSPQQRTVLAQLLLSDSKQVAVDDLVDVLWGEDVPRSGRTTVRTYICRLRRVLTATVADGEVGSVGIRSGGGGYRLTVDPGTVDVWQFRDSLAAARQAREHGDLTEAAHQLRTGLSLWRGTPLAGVTGTFFEGQRAWLEQLHSTATEERLAVGIELGKDAEAAAELTVAVAEQPYRERLWELLMLALYRSGRQADALAAYRDITGLLDRELGLGPGPGLRELHRRILASDPTLVDPPRPPDRPSRAGRPGRESAAIRLAAPVEVVAPARPVQLPPDVGDFVGRGGEMAEIRRHLSISPGPSVVELTGAIGMGKTALAVRVSHSMRHQFPDGQLFATLHDQENRPVDPAEVLVGFLRALGVDPGPSVSLGELAALWRTVLSSRRVLVVLDDVFDSQQVFPLLPSCPGSAMIVTSSRPLVYLPDMYSIKVGPLEARDAFRLLAGIAGERRILAERAAAMRILDTCSYQPRGVRVAARWLASRTSRTVGQIEQHLYEELRQPVAAGPGCRGEEQRYGQVLDRLPAELAHVCRLAALPDSTRLDAAAAGALLDVPAGRAARAFEALVGAHFLEAEPDGTYHMHGVIRTVIRRHALREEGRAACTAALTRLAGFLAATTDGYRDYRHSPGSAA
jgi:DNA-binding SARP family transcriptional activator